MHPPGLIVIPNSGMLRYTQFVIDLLSVDKPPGSKYAFPVSGSVVQNLNRAIWDVHETDSWSWVWCQADDHAFSPDLLMRLLDHERDVVCPLIVRRSTPHRLVIGKEEVFPDEPSGRTYPGYVALALEDVPDELFTVEIAGTAGMLIRRPVLDAIGYPYFESTDGAYLNEDIEFSRKVRRHGFDIWVDPKARMAHLVTTPVWPV